MDGTVQTNVARTESRLERLAARDRDIGALALVLERPALDAARRLDRDGHDGPLAGLTLGIKDLFDVRGTPTGAGSRNPPVAEAPRTAVAVERLVAAGMIPLAKTRTVAFAFGTWGINRATGTPRNPWDRTEVRVPGGSSSGSAVAVAAGLVDAALGTDTGGSVRIPAALNGVTGLKPSSGRIGRTGLLPLCPTLDTVGPMAKDVATVAAMFAALAGPDPDDPSTAGAAAFDPTARVWPTGHVPRLAVLGDAALSRVADPVGEAYLRALSDFEAAGVRLVEVRPPIPLDAFMEPTGLLIAAEAWTLWHEHVERHGADMDPGVLARLSAGRDIGAAERTRLLGARRADQGRMHAWLQDHDALLTPTVPIPAPRLADADEATLPFSHFTRAANWLDLPALAMPCGMTSGHLPVSLQVMGLPLDERRVLALGEVFQKATGWHLETPPAAPFHGGATTTI